MTSRQGALGTEPATTGAGRPLLLALTAILLNVGLVLALAPRHPATMTTFTLALLSFILAVFLPNAGPLRHSRPRHIVGLLTAGLLGQLVLMLFVAPGIHLELGDPAAGTPYVLGLVALAVLIIAILLTRAGRMRGPLFVGILLVFLGMGIWLIRVSPDPWIDVHIFQEQGAETLLAGENPYSIRSYPDIYGEGAPLYAPGLVEDGHLTFGFSYPPLSLFLALPGHILGGDYRFSQLLAMAATAMLVAAMRPGVAAATLAALVFLVTPRTFFVLEQGWTEPYALMLLACTVFLADRRSRLLSVSLGLLTAVKQHMVPMLPLAVLLLDGSIRGRQRWKVGLGALVVATVVSLPLMLWNLPDFINSTVTLHLRQPYRPDSLSYLAWFGTTTEPWLPTWIPFALFIPVAAAASWQLGRSPAAFVTTAALTYFVFFLFSKQSFVHYHYFVMGAVCISLVAWLARTHGTTA